jgi:hypothetical protein
MKNFRFKDLWWLVILLFIVPALGATHARRRGVKVSHVILFIAILGLVARILWIAFHKQ